MTTRATGDSWRGDREQIAALYRELGPVIYRQCRALLRDDEDASDATHEVFLRLVALHSFENKEHAAAWVYQVATRHCLNVIRDSGRRRRKLEPLALPVAPAVSAEVFPAREITQQLLRQFDETTCSVAVGVLVDGFEQTELAQILGLSRKTVGRKLTAFLTRARELLAEDAP